jgi:hypothetical protein
MATYISIVGTQVMAVLNPLLALKEKGEKPAQVHLLETGFTKVRAETIKGFLVESRTYNYDQIRITRISDSLASDNTQYPPAHQVVSELSNNSDKIFFNLAGGMNFQVSACVMKMDTDRCLYIYPESEGVHVIHIPDNGTFTQEIYPLPRPVDVLKLQGITHQKHATMQPHTIWSDFYKRAKNYLPKGESCIQVSDVIFDFVWNRGNELKFLKVISSGNGDHKAILAQARAVISLAIVRDRFGELYHRDVVIVTNDKPTKERIIKEGGGKVKVIVRSELTGLFYKNPGGDVQDPGEEVIPVGNKTTGAKWLITTLGKNLLPTLIALYSHKPDQVCLLYTPNITEIDRYKKSIQEYKDDLGVSTIRFVPVSISGEEILKLTPPDGDAVVEVNITPGSKGQGAFLTLWSKRYNATPYSIENSPPRLADISAGQMRERPLSGPSPLQFLRFSGVEIHDEGKNEYAIGKNAEVNNGIIDFIKMMVPLNQRINDFPTKDIILDDARSKLLSPDTARITFNDSREIQWSLKQNKWFEELLGYAMLNSGATDVQIRLRTAWSKPTDTYLEKKYPGQAHHMTDIDVAARLGAHYLTLECKATEREKTSKYCAKALADASLFGRFAIPFLVFLKYGGEPEKVNGVYVLGYRTFTDFEAMKALIKQAISEAQKTGKTSE